MLMFQSRLARILEWIEGGIQIVDGESLNNIVYSHYLLIIGPDNVVGKRQIRDHFSLMGDGLLFVKMRLLIPSVDTLMLRQ